MNARPPEPAVLLVPSPPAPPEPPPLSPVDQPALAAWLRDEERRAPGAVRAATARAYDRAQAAAGLTVEGARAAARRGEGARRLTALGRWVDAALDAERRAAA